MLDASDERLSFLDREKLREAILEDHDCDDAGCDIDAAVRAGFEECAAWLLTGATEAPATESALASIDIYAGRSLPRGFAGFDGWACWHRNNSVRCSVCRGFTFVDDVDHDRCAHCTVPLPRDDEDDEDDGDGDDEPEL